MSEICGPNGPTAEYKELYHSLTPEQWDAEVARLRRLKDHSKDFGVACTASTSLVRMLTIGKPATSAAGVKTLDGEQR